MAAISSLGVGSGLDLNGLLDKLEKGENKRLVPIVNKQNAYEAKISAFGSLKSALTKLQEAAQALAEKGTFQAVSSEVSGEALTATATSDTPPGYYHIEVQQRAQASSVATLGVADDKANLGAGTITLTLANGDTMSVTLEPENSSLQDIRDAINAQNGGVRASLINDGSGQPHRLVLTARKSGTEAAVSSISFGGDLSGGLQLDTTTRIAGQNARLTVNGIQVESAGNRVEGAVQGVTLNLIDSGEVTLRVNRDNSAIEKSVTAFVDAYNELEKALDDLTGYNADSGTAGILLGSGAVRTVEARLRGVLGSAVGSGEFTVLSQVGVALQLDGTLKLDEEKLDDVVANHADALREFFAGSGESKGLAGQLDSAIGKLTGDDGLIADITDGFKQSIESLDLRYERTQQRIDSLMERYRKQFSQLDSLIAKMNSTSSYLTQQFDMLAQMNSGG